MSEMMDKKDNLKALIELIGKNLVDSPDQVAVSEVNSEQTTIIELRVAQSDLGKIIGKQGRTAKALRTLVHGIGSKQKRRAILEILE